MRKPFVSCPQERYVSVSFIAIVSILCVSGFRAVSFKFLSFDYKPPAIRMTFSSRDIYFHTLSRNQTKLGPVEKYWLESFMMSVPSPFLINSFSSFLLITYQVFCY